jgi:hypothetical protein
LLSSEPHRVYKTCTHKANPSLEKIKRGVKANGTGERGIYLVEGLRDFFIFFCLLSSPQSSEMHHVLFTQTHLEWTFLY